MTRGEGIITAAAKWHNHTAAKWHDTATWRWGPMARLTVEQLIEVNMELMKEGKPPVASTYGKLLEELEDLPRIQNMARKDYKFMMNHLNFLVNSLQHGTEEEKVRALHGIIDFDTLYRWTPFSHFTNLKQYVMLI